MRTVVALEILAFSFLFICALIPSVVSEDYNETWVGSLKGDYTDHWVGSVFTVEFTVYLTITVNSTGSVVGTEHIAISRVSDVPYFVDLRIKSVRMGPASVDVEVSGFSNGENLFCRPEKSVKYHLTEEICIIDPNDGSELYQSTIEDDHWFDPAPLSGYVDVSSKRSGNFMRISGNWSYGDPSVEFGWIASRWAGTLVLLQKGATCINVPRDANILRDGKEEALVQGAEISSGDVIETGGSGKVSLSLPDGSGLKLLADTSVELLELLESNAIRLTLQSGSMWLYVMSLRLSISREKFEVKTPIAIAGVRGTEFTIEVAEDGTTTLTVLEGIVEFSDLAQTKTVTVGQNQTSTMTPGGLPSDPAIIDPELIQRWWEEPIVIPLETDVNQDGVVDTLDLEMIAGAFRTQPGDVRWNVFADLDNNNIVNIFDVSKVAKDFGKTV